MLDLRTLAAALALLSTSSFAASLSLAKGPLVLGQDTEVAVTIRVDEAPGTEDLPLLLEVNVGSFGKVTRAGPGVFKTIYRLPETMFPQVALVAAWRETGPDAPIDFLRIPLYGVTYIPVRARRGAEVSVQVGIDPTPPVTVGRSGVAEVEVAVPPGVKQATVSVRQKKNGPITTRSIPIEVPPYNRLTAALVPQAILADGESWARLELFYDAPGEVLDPAQIQIDASVGAATFQEVRQGRYVYRYQPPADTTHPDVKFKLALAADAVAEAAARLSLRLPAPARVVIKPPPEALVADGKHQGEVAVQVQAESGLALPRQQVTLSANGEPVASQPSYKGNGWYGFTYRAPAHWPPGGEVKLEAAVVGVEGGKVTGSTVYKLEPAPIPAAVHAKFFPHPVPSDGRTAAEVTFDVRDAAGRPLKGAQLALAVGSGKIGEIQEVAPGTYRAAYTPPAALPDGGADLKIRDATGQYQQSLAVPLRADPRRLLLGLRAGATHGLGDLYGPRVGLDLTVPLRIGGSYLLPALTAMGGMATAEVTDAELGFSSRSEAYFLPITARLGYELFAGRTVNLHLGAGATFTVARFSTSLTGEIRHGYSFGGMGYLGTSLSVGPGQLFGEASYLFAPVRAGDFALQAGGVGLEVGYRIALN